MSHNRTGRRERKRAATRQAIAQAALDLFLARGFDDVSVNEVADQADVAPATVFNYFPSKEALLFDRDDHVEAQLVRAVQDRPNHTCVLEALRSHVLSTWVPLATDPALTARRELIERTPALRSHAERSWLQHTDALAAAIAGELGRPADDLISRTLARYVLDIAFLTQDQEDVEAAVHAIFDLLMYGAEPTPRAGPSSA